MIKLIVKHPAKAWLDVASEKERHEYWLAMAEEAVRQSRKDIPHALVIEYRYGFNIILLCKTQQEYRLHRVFERDRIAAEWHKQKLCETS